MPFTGSRSTTVNSLPRNRASPSMPPHHRTPSLVNATNLALPKGNAPILWK